MNSADGSGSVDMEYHRKYMKTYQQSAITENTNYRDHYMVLGLDRDATHTEVRLARVTGDMISCLQVRKIYKSLALKYHPDRNTSKEAADKWDGVPGT